MTYLILSFLLWLSDNRSIERISQKNTARLEALSAYKAGNYERAAAQYSLLIKASLFVEPSARLNLAHSFFHLKRYQQAQQYYRQVASAQDAGLAAPALLQLGVIACLQGDSATALRYYRHALEKQPDLQAAQFNYELISKRFSGKVTKPQTEKQATRKKPQSSQESSQSQAESLTSGREVEKSDRHTDLLKRLRSLNLTEAQVLQLLNSLQDDEVQYIQQRKPASMNSKEAARAYRNW